MTDFGVCKSSLRIKIQHIIQTLNVSRTDIFELNI